MRRPSRPRRHLSSHPTGDLFTDREPEIGSFLKALSERSVEIERYRAVARGAESNVITDEADEAIPLRILSYYGEGGVGKTALRHEMLRRAKADGLSPVYGVLDLKETGHRTPAEALFFLRREMGKRHEAPFPLFDLAYTIYRSRCHRPVSMEEQGWIEKGSLLWDLVSTFGEIPAVSIVPKVYSLIEKGSREVSRRILYKRYESKFREMEAEDTGLADAEFLLFWFWNQDLKRHAAATVLTPLIFIDTYEALWEQWTQEGAYYKRDKWLRDWIWHLPQPLWVVFGRDRLRWEEDEEGWGDFIESHRLGGLARGDTDLYLERRGIVDEAIRRIIYEGSCAEGEGRSGALPFYLYLSGTIWSEVKEKEGREPEASDFARTPKEVLERFLYYINPKGKETLQVLSIPRFWDREIYELLTERFRTGWDWNDFKHSIRRYSFVEERDGNPGTWTMNALMRKGLQERMESGHVRAVSTFLHRHYANSLKEVTAKDLDRRYRTALEEAFHHGEGAMDVRDLALWFREAEKPFADALDHGTLIPLWERLHIFQKMAFQGEENEWCAYSLNRLGALSRLSLNYRMAEEYYHRALAIREKVHGAEGREVADTLNNLGILYRNLGKHDVAEEHYRRALGIYERVLGPSVPAVARVLHNLGALHQERSEVGLAEACYRRALEIREKAEGSDHPSVANTLNSYGALLSKRGDHVRAEEMFARALEIRRKRYGPEHSGIAEIVNNLGALCQSTARGEEGRGHYLEAIRILEKIGRGDTVDAAGTLFNLGMIECLLGNAEGAMSSFRRSLSVLEGLWGRDHPKTRDAAVATAETLDSAGMTKEAAEIRQEHEVKGGMA